MSMLTPPGLGGKYRITGNKYPRMRRGRRRGRLTLTVIASAVVVGVLGWGSMQLVGVFTGTEKASAAGRGKACVTSKTGHAGESRAAGAPAASPTPAAVLPKPKQITVNVLNATTRSGLAKQTADELKKRGFTIGDVGNATAQYDKKVKSVGVLLGPPAALSTAIPVLGTQLTGAEKRADGRKDKAVDLIIGEGFKGLASEAAAAKALNVLTHPAPKPSPSKSC
ncbi:LytR C-terminal domain-containing protein [Streptomyces sp. TS71-3]|uniref:LytR C-terminal domain-containing protein n=1 Tax=Streptomyces sp. TS71-3 TaxID=2733862 RepID=UPI001BB3F6B3|nr:LytR C-terminal domain-containing protein [Streptomyces sp. TS71-3]